jgi:small subunit ribosomal protein S8
MSMNDPISDFLTRVRNAVGARHNTVDVPASGLKAEICRVLKEEGFISDYIVSDEPKPGLIRVTLKYTAERAPVLQGVRRVSRPSLRRYLGAEDIKQVRSGLGIAIISTSKGVMTGRKAREQKVGGELLCEVW